MTIHTHDGDITGTPETLDAIFLAYSQAWNGLRKAGKAEEAKHYLEVADDIFYALQNAGFYKDDPFLCDFPDLRKSA